MPDVFRLRTQTARVPIVPSWTKRWNGYALPEPGRTFHRDQLIELAAANGFTLTHHLLHKWRVWRFIPGPTPGGATGKGPGKGQTWPIGAGWRVAWLARWLADSLTYDALRLCLWPWTRELEADRSDDLVASVRRFLAQDRGYHDRVIERLQEGHDNELEKAIDYVALMFGDASTPTVDHAMESAGIRPGAERHATLEPFVRHLGFEPMGRRFASLTEPDILVFGARLRGNHQLERALIDIFWSSPLALGRVLVRELYWYLLEANPRSS